MFFVVHLVYSVFPIIFLQGEMVLGSYGLTLQLVRFSQHLKDKMKQLNKCNTFIIFVIPLFLPVPEKLKMTENLFKQERAGPILIDFSQTKDFMKRGILLRGLTVEALRAKIESAL